MPTIRTRDQWGARPPKSVHRIGLPTPRLWVHHSADDRQGDAAVRAHQAFHMGTRGWVDIAYSFLIGNDGTIYFGRGPGVAGGHTKGDNTTSHGICLLGNFENRAPSAAAADSLVWLARHGREEGWWVPTLGGHRDAGGATTACPGRHLYALLPTIRTRVASSVPAPKPAPPTPDTLEDDDMVIIRTKSPNRAAAVAGGKMLSITGETNAANAEKAGVPVFYVENDEWNRFVKAFGPIVS